MTKEWEVLGSDTGQISYIVCMYTYVTRNINMNNYNNTNKNVGKIYNTHFGLIKTHVVTNEIISNVITENQLKQNKSYSHL